jgi:CHAT domain-containing protein/tetratricopeptide (TPR) repeat protein
MMHILVAIPAAAIIAAQPPQTGDLRTLARTASDSVLVDRARREADAVRSAMTQLRIAGAGDDATGRAALGAGERLAAAYAIAWSDSFHVRRFARYRALSVADRQATVMADSIFRMGEAALGASGPETAMRLWRESLRRHEALGDTVGIASSIRRLGLGFYYLQLLDSAEAYFDRARELGERIGDLYLAGNAMSNVATVILRRGDASRAIALYERARPFRERTGDIAGLAADKNNLGNLARTMGDLRSARQAYREAAEILLAAGEEEDAALALRNLGVVALTEGDFETARQRYGEALAIVRKHGNQGEEANLLEDHGLVAVARGDYRAGVAAFVEAAEILRRTGPNAISMEIDVRTRLAMARASMGDLQGARAELARAETLATRVDTSAFRAGLMLGRVALAQAELAAGFNQFAEAERQFARAERLATRPDLLEAEVRQVAQHGAAELHARRGSYARARASVERLLADTSALTHELRSRSRLLFGEIAWRQGDTAAARRVVAQSLAAVRAVGYVAGEAEALARLADFERRAGRPAAAEELFRRGIDRLGGRPAAGVGWDLHSGLAGALRMRGAHADAARELEAAIAQLERVSGALSVEEIRSAFLADKWDVYVDLAVVELERGRMQASFEASERLRARQMLDLLARGRVAAGRAIGDLAAREQDLRRRIAELAQQAERADSSAQELRGAASPPGASDADATLAAAQRAYAELLVEIREVSPAYAALVRGEVADARTVMAALAPDEALIEYLVGDSTTLAFVVTADTVLALDLRMTQAALAERVDFARNALGSATESAARRAWRAPMRQLHDRLVAPVEATRLLAGKRRLLIVPHAELHYLPFAALVRAGTPERLLVEDYVVEYVPSASVWLRLRDRRGAASGNGVLALAPRPAALPGSRAEIAAIRALYGDRARTFVGTSATERTFRDLAPGQDVIHLATHGIFNKSNPLFSYIDLGPGIGDDGRLEVHEVFGLTLGARLVVLSACQTGVGAGRFADVPPGDDWVGLVQAFLFAGAGNVLGTLWPVQDAATSRLMERFYRELAGGRSEAEALALAQRAAVRDPASAHPFFWSGFTLVRGR